MIVIVNIYQNPVIYGAVLSTLAVLSSKSNLTQGHVSSEWKRQTSPSDILAAEPVLLTYIEGGPSAPFFVYHTVWQKFVEPTMGGATPGF